MLYGERSIFTIYAVQGKVVKMKMRFGSSLRRNLYTLFTDPSNETIINVFNANNYIERPIFFLSIFSFHHGSKSFTQKCSDQHFKAERNYSFIHVKSFRSFHILAHISI